MQAVKSRDPLVKMRRERSNSFSVQDVHKEAASRSSVSFGSAMSQRKARFVECCSLNGFLGQLSGLR